MNFTNLRFGAKLGAAFFLNIVLTVPVGAAASVQLARIDSHTEDISTNWLPGIKVLGQIGDTANPMRRAEADLLISLGDKDAEAAHKRLEDMKKKLATLQAACQPLISSEAEKNAYSQFRQHLEAYYAAGAKLLRQLRGGEQTFERSKALYHGESRTAFQR